DAFLSEADLSGASLCQTDFGGAYLGGANLSGADLSATILGWADLTEASLNGADFSDAVVGATIFGDNNLSSAIGLETVQHQGPSIIGVNTFYESRGQIPEVFLRGCGVPENFIPFIKSLVSVPIEFYSCFISYSHTDKSFARRLHDQLQAR